MTQIYFQLEYKIAFPFNFLPSLSEKPFKSWQFTLFLAKFIFYFSKNALEKIRAKCGLRNYQIEFQIHLHC